MNGLGKWLESNWRDIEVVALFLILIGTIWWTSNIDARVRVIEQFNSTNLKIISDHLSIVEANQQIAMEQVRNLTIKVEVISSQLNGQLSGQKMH